MKQVFLFLTLISFAHLFGKSWDFPNYKPGLIIKKELIADCKLVTYGIYFFSDDEDVEKITSECKHLQALLEAIKSFNASPNEATANELSKLLSK